LSDAFAPASGGEGGTTAEPPKKKFKKLHLKKKPKRRDKVPTNKFKPTQAKRF